MWYSFNRVLKLRFVYPIYLCSYSLHGISQTTPRHLLTGTISFPEDRIVNFLIIQNFLILWSYHSLSKTVMMLPLSALVIIGSFFNCCNAMCFFRHN